MVHLTSTLALAAALLSSASAIVVNYYNDEACTDLANTVHVFDNTCSTATGLYSSFIIITGPTDSGQFASAFSRNACAGAVTACISGNQLNQCTRVVNGDGASNAMGSGTSCGTA